MDVQEIYGRKMREKDKGEGAGVGREGACPPQWGSDHCAGRAGRKTEMEDWGRGKSHCRARPFQEPYGGQTQPAPPRSVVGWELPSASPHSSGCQGHGRPRLSVQGNLSGTFPRLLWLPHTTWPKPTTQEVDKWLQVEERLPKSYKLVVRQIWLWVPVHLDEPQFPNV